MNAFSQIGTWFQSSLFWIWSNVDARHPIRYDRGSYIIIQTFIVFLL